MGRREGSNRSRIQRTVRVLITLIIIFAVTLWVNCHYRIVAFDWGRGGDYDLKVLTWNIHCPHGADEQRQAKIANLVIKEDADFVLLNEFMMDSCMVLFDMLKEHYKYYELEYANMVCGDIFFSKLPLNDSGHTAIPVQGKSVHSINATLAIGSDSVYVVGVHLASNNSDGDIVVNAVDSLKKVGSFYDRYKLRQEDRNYSMMWIKRWLRDHEGMSAIVMGDMNDFDGAAPLDSLKDMGMKDAWWEGGMGYGCTYHEGWMRLRIDHVMYGSLKSNKNLEVVDARVIDTELSDHNPLVVRFVLK